MSACSARFVGATAESLLIADFCGADAANCDGCICHQLGQGLNAIATRPIEIVSTENAANDCAAGRRPSKKYTAPPAIANSETCTPHHTNPAPSEFMVVSPNVGQTFLSANPVCSFSSTQRLPLTLASLPCRRLIPLSKSLRAPPAPSPLTSSRPTTGRAVARASRRTRALTRSPNSRRETSS